MKKLFSILFVSMLFINAFTQSSTLTPADIKKFAKQAQTRIEEFTETISEISQPYEEKKGCDAECHKKYVASKTKSVLQYFKRNARVEVVNLDKKKRKYEVDFYLNNVVVNYGKRFKVVVVEFSNVLVNPNSLKEEKKNDGSSKYTLKGTYKQLFKTKSKKDNKETNEDDVKDWDMIEVTTKEFTLEVEKITTPSGTKWIALLGDISATSIENLKD